MLEKRMTTTVEFGTFCTAQSDIASTAQTAEALGYDILGCGEHVSFYGPVTNSYVTLGVAAGATSTIKLMSGIVLLPLYPAALAAKLGAALDVASGGRYMFGVGVGGEYPREFEACGVPVNERGARTDEALQVIRRLWTEESVTFDGRFSTLNDVSIAPQPEKTPPIWVAGRKKSAMRRTARYADGWLPYMYTPEQLAESIETIRSMREEEGRSPDDFTAGVFLWSAVDEDGAKAKQAAIDMLSTNYSQDFTELVDKYALAGDPEHCRSRLQEYIDAGARMVMLAPATSESASPANVALMANEVVSKFR